MTEAAGRGSTGTPPSVAPGTGGFVVIRESVASLERLDAEADLPASAEPKAWQALAA